MGDVNAAGQIDTGITADVIDDYRFFSPMEYLHEYWSDSDQESDFSARFLHEIFESLEPQKTMVDVGGGPTLYQLISARNKVESITFAEYLESNRCEVEKWVKDEPGAFNWDIHLKYTHELEGQAYAQSIDEMKTCLRKKLIEFVPCDLTKSPSIPGQRRTFDIVSSHFCVEHISKDYTELKSRLATLLELLKPSGYLIMSFLRNASSYQVGTFNFYSYPINETEVQVLLKQLGCDVLRIESGPAETCRTYEGTFSLLARRVS